MSHLARCSLIAIPACPPPTTTTSTLCLVTCLTPRSHAGPKVRSRIPVNATRCHRMIECRFRRRQGQRQSLNALPRRVMRRSGPAVQVRVFAFGRQDLAVSCTGEHRRRRNIGRRGRAAIRITCQNCAGQGHQQHENGVADANRMTGLPGTSASWFKMSRFGLSPTPQDNATAPIGATSGRQIRRTGSCTMALEPGVMRPENLNMSTILVAAIVQPSPAILILDCLAQDLSEALFAQPLRVRSRSS